MDVGECNGRRLYTALRLDYRLRLWAPTSASRAISAVAELLVADGIRNLRSAITYHLINRWILFVINLCNLLPTVCQD